MRIFIEKTLATFSLPVDVEEPKHSFFSFTPRSGTALSKIGERSGLIINQESAACFIRIGAPNATAQPRGPSEDELSDAGESAEDGRLSALRCGGLLGSSDAPTSNRETELLVGQLKLAHFIISHGLGNDLEDYLCGVRGI